MCVGFAAPGEVGPDRAPTFFFGPALPVGGSSVTSSVCPSVPLSSPTSHYRIFPIFCNKLAFNECRKVTKPDFCGKNYLG